MSPVAASLDKFEFLSFLTDGSDGISVSEMAANLAVTFVLAMFVFLVYKYTYSGVHCSRSFGASLVITSLVTAMIMMVIGSNLALSLGMVGALSIVRYRAAMKDPQDVAFIFWEVGIGLSAGTGVYLLAAAGSLVISACVILFFIAGPSPTRYLLIVRADAAQNGEIESAVRQNSRRSLLKVCNTNNGEAERIYELSIKRGRGEALCQAVSAIESVRSVNLVASNEDV